VDGRIADQFGGRIAVHKFRAPVDLQDYSWSNRQVGYEHTDGHVLKQVAIALLASLVDPAGMTGCPGWACSSGKPIGTFVDHCRHILCMLIQRAFRAACGEAFLRSKCSLFTA
jgi:hypothetical protein